MGERIDGTETEEAYFASVADSMLLLPTVNGTLVFFLNMQPNSKLQLLAYKETPFYDDIALFKCFV